MDTSIRQSRRPPRVWYFALLISTYAWCTAYKLANKNTESSLGNLAYTTHRTAQCLYLFSQDSFSVKFKTGFIRWFHLVHPLSPASIFRQFLPSGGRSVSIKSAICLSIMTSVCPASNGEQAIAKVSCQQALPKAAAAACSDYRAKAYLYATVVKRATRRRYEPLRRKEPDGS